MVVTPDLARHLYEMSQDLGRQIGLLIERRGQVEHVFVGDAAKIYLPDFGRLRAGLGRFRGLRLIHTHLRAEALSQDDLADLILLRLDMVVALTRPLDTGPVLASMAHLLPAGGAQDVDVSDPVPVTGLDMDFAQSIHELEEEFARTAGRQPATPKLDHRGILVHVSQHAAAEVENRISELRELAETAGLEIVQVVRQRRSRPDPKYVVGRGKMEDVVLLAMQHNADILVFDPDLRPSQARAITQMTDMKVIDRSMLILDIFAQRAQTRAGKIQVELAQLRYALPRLAAKNTMMSRLTGEIGGRGPGETKLEINRRRARERIVDLERQIKKLSRQRAVRRKMRMRQGVPVVALVGYTNAGKSTLLNTLTNASVLTENRLFVTLDPTSRRLRLPRNQDIILTDTVGFIEDLPSDLVDAFRSTLEELDDADLLVHVVDGADPRRTEKRVSVERILAGMGLGGIPQVTVYNKIDLVRDEGDVRLIRRDADVVVAAVDPVSLGPLVRAIRRTVASSSRHVGAS
ncbi:MAG: GTPase HflX [Deltaproteobacteria bacterium]|nr:GTPase HflX [Deltaproteobacteria bacterium]